VGAEESLIGMSRWFGFIRGSAPARRVVGSSVVDTRRGRVEYAVRGSGPAVLAIHGSPGGYDQGLLIFDELKGRGFSLVAPSRPGYLRTPLAGGASPAEQADLVAALLEEIGVENVLVAGASGGGPCACQFALRYPEKTSALLLYSAVVTTYLPHQDSVDRLLSGFFCLDIGSWLMSLIAHLSPNLMAQALLSAGGEFSQRKLDQLVDAIMMDPRKVAFVSAIIDTMTPASLRNAGLENDMAQFRVMAPPPLERIQCPTLVVHGLDDKNTSMDHPRYALAKISGAEHIFLEDASHLLELSVEADMVWDRVAEFFVLHSSKVSRLTGQ